VGRDATKEEITAMASTSSSFQIVLPDKKELEKLPQFSVAAKQLNDLNIELTTLEKEARGLKLVDKTTFDRMDAINKRSKQVIKDAETLVEPYKTPLRKWMDFVQQHFNAVKNRAEQMRMVVGPKMETYVREDEAKRKAEQDRIQLEIDEKNRIAANEKRQADLKLAADRKKEQVAECKKAYAAGQMTKRAYVAKMKELDAEAEAAKEQAELTAETTKAAPPKVTVAPSVRTGRTYYHATCEDRKTFVETAIKRAQVGDQSMMNFIIVDAKGLENMAGEVRDSTKMATMFPGVKAWDTKSF
jgi:hypothetical protein